MSCVCSIVSGASSQRSTNMSNAPIAEEVSVPTQQGFKNYSMAEESVSLSLPPSAELHQHHSQQEVDCREERSIASATSSSMGLPPQVLSQAAYTDQDCSYSVAKDIISTKNYLSEQTNVCKVCFCRSGPYVVELSLLNCCIKCLYQMLIVAHCYCP